MSRVVRVALAVAAVCGPGCRGPDELARPANTSTSAASESVPSSGAPSAPGSTSPRTAAPRPHFPELAWRNPPGFGGAVNAAWSDPDGSFVAVGENGLVLRGAAAAGAFAAIDAGVSDDLAAVWGTGKGLVVAVGAGPADGVVLRSQDHGATWVVGRIDGARLTAVAGRSAEEIYLCAVNGTIRGSFDEARSWTAIHEAGRTLNTVWVAPTGEIYAGGEEGLLLRSPRRGAPFVEVASRTKDEIHVIWGPNGREIFAGGGAYEGAGVTRGFLLLSTDHGAHFRLASAGTEIVGALFGHESSRLAVTHGGSLLRAPRTGLPFTKVAEAGAPLTTMVGDERGNIVALGSAGQLLRSSDAGRSWQAPPIGLRDDLNAVWGRGPGDLYAVGIETSGPPGPPGAQKLTGVVAHSTDAGRSWSRSVVEGTLALYAVWGSGPSSVFAVGFGGAVVRSVDRGRSWQLQRTPATKNLNALWGSGPTDVYAVGDGGTIAHTKDGGETWQLETSGTLSRLDAVWGAGPEEIYAGGETGLLLRSADGGATWTAIELGTKEPLASIAGSEGGLVYVGLARGRKLLRSLDHGASWEHLDIPHDGIRALASLGPSGVFAVGGSSGELLWSANRGEAWAVRHTGAVDLGAVWARAQQAVFVGDDGAVLVAEARP